MSSMISSMLKADMFQDRAGSICLVIQLWTTNKDSAKEIQLYFKNYNS